MALQTNAAGPCSLRGSCMAICLPAVARGHGAPHVISPVPAFSVAQWAVLHACQRTRPVRVHNLLRGRVSVSAHAWLPQQAAPDGRPRASAQRCSASKGNSTADRKLWDNVDATSPDEADATSSGAAAPAAEQDSMGAGEWSSYMQNYSGMGGSEYNDGLGDLNIDEQNPAFSPNGSEAWAGEANYDDRQACVASSGSGSVEEPPEATVSNDWAPVSSSSDWGDWADDGTAWSTQSSYNGVDSRVDPLDQILGTSQRLDTVRAGLRDGPQPLADPVRAPRTRRGSDGEDESGEREGDEGADDDGIPPIPSDITGLSRGDFEALLPLRPSMPQKRFYEPATLPERVVELLGSLGASMLLSKAVLLAAPALLYPLWNSWMRAGLRNLELYSRQFTAVGMWRATLIEAEVLGWASGPLSMGPFPGRGTSIRLVVGDAEPGGARVALEFPYQPRAELLVPGEPAELLVLSQDDDFVEFKAVREVYLPASGLWLADYPFVDRTVFLDISLEIEAARQAEAEEEQRAAAAGGVNAGATRSTQPRARPGVWENVDDDLDARFGASS